MKLLFIQGGSRLKQTQDGRWYTDANFSDEIWLRYMELCDNLTIMLRREKKAYASDEAIKRFNPIPNDSRIRVVALDDITKPKYNLLNPFVWRRIRNMIFKEIEKADKIIIRSASKYCQIAREACLSYRKPYLHEVTGFAREGLRYHSLLGRISAESFEKSQVRLARDAECCIYVTEEALQKRYPCKKMLGCSDVALLPSDSKVLESRLQKIDTMKDNSILHLGTAAFLDVKWKGQELVIRALAVLKSMGITNVIYELVGLGKGSDLFNLACKLGVKDQVKIVGAMPHDEIFPWLDSIDIYIQASYQEGLCRIIAEAISRACPVICSDTGGNYELISKDYIFPCGDYKQLSKLILKIKKNLKKQAIRNFERSKHYDKDVLDMRRKEFFKDYMENHFGNNQ